MKANHLQHLCHICNRRPAAGEEHIPPQHTNNKGVVEIIYIDGTTPSGDIKFHVISSSEGFWVPALCENCNNMTGWRYGTAYKDFVSQIADASDLEDTSGRALVNLKSVYPLRILKQIFSMFLVAVPFEPAPVWKEIQDFVRKRDCTLPESAPYVYLYKNISNLGRIVPCCGIAEFSTNKSFVVSEVSWPPVGIIYAFEADERFKIMEDITHWGRFRFKDRGNFLIKLPKLRVASHYPLGFGTAQEVEREQGRRGLAYIFHVPEDSASHNNISVLWRRQEYQMQNRSKS